MTIFTDLRLLSALLTDLAVAAIAIVFVVGFVWAFISIAADWMRWAVRLAARILNT